MRFETILDELLQDYNDLSAIIYVYETPLEEIEDIKEDMKQHEYLKDRYFVFPMIDK